jgi:hypothetical protein
MVSKGLIFASGPCIAASDLPLPESEPSAARGCAPALNLDNVEREMVFKALTQTGGHHDKAARMLGISRRTLSRKLKTYGAPEMLEFGSENKFRVEQRRRSAPASGEIWLRLRPSLARIQRPPDRFQHERLLAGHSHVALSGTQSFPILRQWTGGDGLTELLTSKAVS